MSGGRRGPIKPAGCPADLFQRWTARYVVINTGHTFHDPQFKASNAQLYPRLGDYAVLKVAAQASGGYEEKPKLAGIFDESWRLATSQRSEQR